MKIHNNVAFFFAVAFSSIQYAHAQHVGDSSFQSSAIKRAIGIYHSSLFPENALYNGNEYIPHQVRFRNDHAYFQTDKPVGGSVTYDNMLFENVSLMLDLIKEELIIIHPVTQSKVRLIKSKIQSFTIGNNHFLHVKEDTAHQSKRVTGFYQLMYNGGTVVLKKMTKSIKEELVTGQRASYSVIEKLGYYIETDNRFYLVRNKRSLFDALKDKKKELKVYYKKEHLDFHFDKEKAIMKTVAYYDEIKD